MTTRREKTTRTNRFAPRVETLEDRLAPATFVVNSTADPGNGICDAAECTLREALTGANATPGFDTVAFDIPGPAPYPIQVRSLALPVITDPVTVDGTTQPGYTGTPVVIIDGRSVVGEVTNGLEITAGNSTFRGLVISLFTGTGLVLGMGGGNLVEGNYIGTDVSGTLANANRRGGIAVNASSRNQIGGTTIAGTSNLARNLVSGNELNGIGLHNGSNDNRIQGNHIGTNATGTGALRNSMSGVAIDGGSQNNLIGTDGDGADDSDEGNVISGNGWNGIGIGGPNTRANRVAGNRLGLAATGGVVMANGRAGIFINDSAQLNIIGTDGNGGNDAAERNIISGNAWDGVHLSGVGTNQNIIAGNYIGIGPGGTGDRGNGQDGIELLNGPRENRIGTNADGISDELERNVISGNGLAGVAFKGNSSFNIVAGNYIGTNAEGTAARGNTYDGVYMDGGSDFNQVGTNGDGQFDAAERNIISGNRVHGINLVNVRSTHIAGNYIGTNAAGTAALGNGGGCGFPGCAGVVVQSGSQSNLIGTNGESVDNLAERNVIAGNSGFGVTITSANFNIVAGNRIGTDASGRQQLRNGYIGVFILQASRNRIGTDSNGLGDEAERNVIGANGFAVGSGVTMQGTGANNNTVAGNFIGTDVTGSLALDIPSHLYGVVLLEGANNNLIGGAGPLAGNLISGNLIGVQIADLGTGGNRLLGNAIGTQADRTSRLGNLAHGVLVTRGASGNTIGGPNPGQGNVIAFNGGTGVVVASGTGNAIRGNSIHSNVGLGIDLGFDGVTPNDDGDADTGPNLLQNFPTLYAAVTDGVSWTWVAGELRSTPDRAFVIDFYASPTADPTGYGEGELYLGTVTYRTDETGYAYFEEMLEFPAIPGGVLTATATDENGNTSEFSAAILAEPSSGPVRGDLSDPAALALLDLAATPLPLLLPAGPRPTWMQHEERERAANLEFHWPRSWGSWVAEDGELPRAPRTQWDTAIQRTKAIEEVAPFAVRASLVEAGE